MKFCSGQGESKIQVFCKYRIVWVLLLAFGLLLLFHIEPISQPTDPLQSYLAHFSENFSSPEQLPGYKNR